ncbi:MAG: MBL fold metallo-hydrolase [Myxococcales bacterium]
MHSWAGTSGIPGRAVGRGFRFLRWDKENADANARPHRAVASHGACRYRKHDCPHPEHARRRNLGNPPPRRAGRLFPQGNTTVIAGDKAVLVVDSCLLPSSAKQDIEQIRKWTQKPVTWLVNTHWHFDHTAGNAAYADAFPGLQIVAHEHTKKMIESFNPGAIARYPGRQQRFEKMLQMGKDQDGKP